MRVAYVMHVDWDWIKQRPHFLAEGLMEYYDVDIYFVVRLGGAVSNNLRPSKADMFTLKKLPLSGRSRFLSFLEKIQNARSLDNLYERSYDILWVTSPIVLNFLDLDRVNHKRLVYDCMDDIPSFSMNHAVIKRLADQERCLLRKSDLVITSSSRLGQLVVERGACQDKVRIVNNAVDQIFQSSLLSKLCDSMHVTDITKRTFNMMYFGTISSWFDIDLLIALLGDNDKLQITLVGPSDVDLPSVSRLIYRGAVSHDKLIQVSEEADAFIMPFRPVEVVKSVDPVKAYEYVCTGKPTFLLRYPETEKFADVSFLYSDKEELQKLLKGVMTGWISPAPTSQIRAFAEGNTWSSRMESIRRTFDDMFA